MVNAAGGLIDFGEPGRERTFRRRRFSVIAGLAGLALVGGVVAGLADTASDRANTMADCATELLGTPVHAEVSPQDDRIVVDGGFEVPNGASTALEACLDANGNVAEAREQLPVGSDSLNGPASSVAGAILQSSQAS